MIKFIVTNRKSIDDGYFPEGDNVRAILVSITDPNKDSAKPSGGYINTCFCKFDDADVQKTPEVKVIDRKTAKFIYDFVDLHIKNGIDTVVVNCEAGQSRSAGCAAALSCVYNGSDEDVIRTKPMYNRKVYREVINAAFEDVDYNRNPV